VPGYAATARRATQALDDAFASPSSCCGGGLPLRQPRDHEDGWSVVGANAITRALYDAEAAGALAASLDCGTLTLLADLHPGETVLDLTPAQDHPARAPSASSCAAVNTAPPN
jgi:hypothetical protein